MKAFTQINLEYGHPSCEQAIAELKSALASAKQNKIGCMVIIHGYGSSGVGGVIRKKARQILVSRKGKGELKKVIFGEDFDIFHIEALELKKAYPQTAEYIGGNNHGITIVEI